MRISRMKMSVLIIIVMLVSFTVGAYAADGIKEVKAFLREDFKIVLDGRTIKLENAALIYKDSSYLPLRELAILVGMNIDWDDKTKTVSLITPTVEVDSDTTPESSPDEGAGNVPTGNTQYPEEFMFSNVLIYKITLDSKEYYVLANDEKNIIYFRKSDVELMNIDLSGLKTVKEKHTSELYYPANELSARLINPGKFEVSNDIIIVETNSEKLKALKAYATRTSIEKAFYIKAVSGTDQYEILLQDGDRRFLMYKVKLMANYYGAYYVGSSTRDYLYD